MSPKELKDVYDERNRLVAALAQAHKEHAYVLIDEEWPVVYINLPTGQVSWHVPLAALHYMPEIPVLVESPWDGHSSDEKYIRLLSYSRASRQD